jgi:septum formation protein
MCREGQPVWRHVGVAHMTMRPLSDDSIETYVDRNWPDIAEAVGAYQLESEGVRLFARVDGDYFTILGLPLLDLLSFLIGRGDLPT